MQVGLFVALVCLLSPGLGAFMARVFSGESTLLTPCLAGLERRLYRLAGCDPRTPMRWSTYAAALLAFNLVGFLAVLALQLTQQHLPLNPQKLPPVPLALALNTAVSFTTNTNWQAYSGEATLSYLTQMLGLTVQNFVSAATGIAGMLALTRGLARRSGVGVGNFWADLVRCTLYVLLPLSFILALLLVSQGVVQTLAPYGNAVTLEGSTQVIPLGPVASQVAIKQLGTNGGGYFGANSAHPFENATPLANLLEMLAILLIPAALPHTYGRMVGSRRHGWVLFGAMLVLFLVGLAVALSAELRTGTLEGKEVRFGMANSVLWATATTAAANGSVNAMHDSLSPSAGMVAMVNMLLGEVVFGGVGAGLYGMLMFVLLAVFIAGLMVGRTPEYLGKRVEARDVALAMVAIFAPCATVLVAAAVAVIAPAGRASLTAHGPHGLSQVLYAFASTANNNGSAFAGLNANTGFYNCLGALAMLIGRATTLGPALAIAGTMAGKRVSPPSAGTFPTDGGLFAVLLVAVVLIVAALTFLPALTLGPILEHLLMRQGQVF